VDAVRAVGLLCSCRRHGPAQYSGFASYWSPCPGPQIDSTTTRHPFTARKTVSIALARPSLGTHSSCSFSLRVVQAFTVGRRLLPYTMYCLEPDEYRVEAVVRRKPRAVYPLRVVRRSVSVRLICSANYNYLGSYRSTYYSRCPSP